MTASHGEYVLAGGCCASVARDEGKGEVKSVVTNLGAKWGRRGRILVSDY